MTILDFPREGGRRVPQEEATTQENTARVESDAEPFVFDAARAIGNLWTAVRESALRLESYANERRDPDLRDMAEHEADLARRVEYLLRTTEVDRTAAWFAYEDVLISRGVRPNFELMQAFYTAYMVGQREA